jgi:hypothetical protein
VISVPQIEKQVQRDVADHGLAVIQMSVNLEFVAPARKGERSSKSDLHR